MTILMTMVSISKSALEARMLGYFRQVERTVEELVVTSGGRPVLRIVPFVEKRSVDDVFDDVRGRLTIVGNPDEPTLVEWPDA